jgi:hypothetical protein
MNATVCKPTELAVALHYYEQLRPLRTTQIADAYATAPIEAIRPIVITEIQPAMNEESLHSSFENAISERLTAQHKQWGRLSSGELNVPALTYSARTRITDPFFNVQDATKRTYINTPNTEPLHLDTLNAGREPASTVQRYTICICTALILLMSGFDLMGLLIMHMMH